METPSDDRRDLPRARQAGTLAWLAQPLPFRRRLLVVGITTIALAVGIAVVVELLGSDAATVLTLAVPMLIFGVTWSAMGRRR